VRLKPANARFAFVQQRNEDKDLDRTTTVDLSRSRKIHGRTVELAQKYLQATPTARDVPADVLEQVVRAHMEALEPCTRRCAARRPRPNRLARPWRNNVLGGLTKPPPGDDEDYERREERTHIGRGSQYCSIEYQAELGIRISMSGKTIVVRW
jgi:uncharacterized protein YuzE